MKGDTCKPRVRSVPNIIRAPSGGNQRAGPRQSKCSLHSGKSYPPTVREHPICHRAVATAPLTIQSQKPNPHPVTLGELLNIYHTSQTNEKVTRALAKEEKKKKNEDHLPRTFRRPMASASSLPSPPLPPSIRDRTSAGSAPARKAPAWRSCAHSCFVFFVGGGEIFW